MQQKGSHLRWFRIEIFDSKKCESYLLKIAITLLNANDKPQVAKILYLDYLKVLLTDLVILQYSCVTSAGPHP